MMGVGHIVKPALSLFVVAAISAVSIGLVYDFMSGPIAENQRRTRERMLTEILPAAVEFSDAVVIPAEMAEGKVRILTIFEGRSGGETVGYVVELVSGEGYGGDINMMVGISGAENKISGMRVLRHGETPGFGAVITRESFFRRFDGIALRPLTVVTRPSSSDEEFQAITSSTITTRAIVNAVNEAIEWYNTSRGGR